MKVKRIYYGFILSDHFEQINQDIKNSLIETKGDIFKIFIYMYDCIDRNFEKNEDIELYKKIFENIKSSEDSKIFKKLIEEKPQKIKEFYEYIDTSKLKVNSKEDIETIEKILFTLTTKAIIMRFKYDSKEKAREEYLKQLEYVKYGILKP